MLLDEESFFANKEAIVAEVLEKLRKLCYSVAPATSAARSHNYTQAASPRWRQPCSFVNSKPLAAHYPK